MNVVRGIYLALYLNPNSQPNFSLSCSGVCLMDINGGFTVYTYLVPFEGVDLVHLMSACQILFSV